MPAGRPSEQVPQNKAEEILSWIESGRPLREFCRIEGNPAWRTVYDWLDKDKEFGARFARAREIGHDVIADECLEIADDGSNDYMTITRGDETYNVEDKEFVNRSRLRIETRLKLLAKWNPKKWGEKLHQELSGELNVNLAERLDSAIKRASEPE
jgi:hypothetical protein